MRNVDRVEDRLTITPPTVQQLKERISAKSKEERFRAAVDYLYIRRNWFTHAASFQNDHDLIAMQNERLANHKAGLSNKGRTIVVVQQGDEVLFVYHYTGNPIQDHRFIIARGMYDLMCAKKNTSIST